MHLELVILLCVCFGVTLGAIWQAKASSTSHTMSLAGVRPVSPQAICRCNRAGKQSAVACALRAYFERLPVITRGQRWNDGGRSPVLTADLVVQGAGAVSPSPHTSNHLVGCGCALSCSFSERSRVVRRRHTVHITDRWAMNRTSNLQTAFFNVTTSNPPFLEMHGCYRCL